METWIIIGLLVALAIYGVSIYNRLVSLRNAVRNAFAQIDVQLTRRYDLIPNLVEAVKGYMAHERETLDAVVQARNQASAGLKAVEADPANAGAMRDLVGAEAALTGALGRMFALVEAYPDLKASQNMQKLQEELATTENRVAFSRQAFNDAVMRFNVAVQQFPSNIVANMFSFNEAGFLEIESAEKREVPKVSFS
ncbi:MAG: LemA family protein [Gammaproteobacteria bacterium]|nr:LemA family protein [Gammaproteobacteria bacterium]